MQLNPKNNVKVKIKNTVTSTGTLVVVENSGLLGDDFTSLEKSFKGVLVKENGIIVSQMEIVKVKSKNGENLVIDRAVEKCPLNYNASEMSQTPYQFETGDYLYLSLTAGSIQEIIDNINQLNSNKIDKSDTTVTKQGNSFNQANKLLKLDSGGKVPSSNLPIQEMSYYAETVEKAYNFNGDFTITHNFGVMPKHIRVSSVFKISGSSSTQNATAFGIYHVPSSIKSSIYHTDYSPERTTSHLLYQKISSSDYRSLNVKTVTSTSITFTVNSSSTHPASGLFLIEIF